MRQHVTDVELKEEEEGREGQEEDKKTRSFLELRGRDL